jgi:hypothetical protein
MYMSGSYRPDMATISISVDERVTKVFAAKLHETEAAEARLAVLDREMKASQDTYNVVLNAANHGQGEWAPVGVSHGILKQREKAFQDLQKKVAELNNQLNGMRKSFWNECERAAAVALPVAPKLTA